MVLFAASLGMDRLEGILIDICFCEWPSKKLQAANEDGGAIISKAQVAKSLRDFIICQTSQGVFN